MTGDAGDALTCGPRGVVSWAVKAGPGAVEGFGPGVGLRCGPKGKGGVGREGVGASGLGCWAWLRKWAEVGWAGLRVLSLFAIPFLFPILFYS